MMASSPEGSVIRTIWDEKIVNTNAQKICKYRIFLGFKIKPYSPTVAEVDSVLDGKLIFIDWKSGLEPAIYVKYSTPSGDPLVSEMTRVS